MQLLDILKNIGTDLQQGLGRIPPEAMVGTGTGFASGQPGAPLAGFAQGMSAHQQALADAEDRELARQKFDLQRQELDMRLEGLRLSNEEKKALAAGRERLATVLKQNPNISPTDAFRLAAMETGSEDWLVKWGDAEQKTAQAQQLQEYRDAMLGISATNAATNASNAQTNAARIAQEQQAKAAERAKETGLAVQGLDQQVIDSQTQLADTYDLTQQVLQHPGFARNYGLTGVMPNIPGQAGEDARVLVERIANSEVLKNTDQLKGVLSDTDMKILRNASTTLQNYRQSPESAAAEVRRLAEVIQRAHQATSKAFVEKRGALQGTPAPAAGPSAPAGAQGGKTATRAQIERLAQRRGVSVEQAMQDAQAAGFRVLP